MDPKDELPGRWPEFDPGALLRRFVEAGVDFVVIGGIAVILHGYPRITRDLDILFASDDGNLEALGRVLTALGASLRHLDEDVPFIADTRTLDGVELLTLDTSAGWLDVHKTAPGAPPYERLRRNAERMDVGGFSVLVASIDDLIAMKRAAARPLDLTDIEALEAIKRLRKS